MKKVLIILIILAIGSFLYLTPNLELVGKNEDGLSVYYDDKKVFTYDNPEGADVVLVLMKGNQEVDHMGVSFYKVNGDWKWIKSGQKGEMNDCSGWSKEVAKRLDRREQK